MIGARRAQWIARALWAATLACTLLAAAAPLRADPPGQSWKQLRKFDDKRIGRIIERRLRDAVGGAATESMREAYEHAIERDTERRAREAAAQRREAEAQERATAAHEAERERVTERDATPAPGAAAEGPPASSPAATAAAAPSNGDARPPARSAARDEAAFARAVDELFAEALDAD